MEQITQPPTIRGNPRRCIFLIAAAVVLYLASEQWFFPWLRDFAARAYCEQVLGFNGSLVLTAVLFIGLTFGFFVITVWLAFVSSKVIKSGQMPPPDALVCRDTVPKTGRSVIWRAYIGLGLPVVGIVFIGWGILAFADLKNNVLDPGLEKAQKTCVMKDDFSYQHTRVALVHG